MLLQRGIPIVFADKLCLSESSRRERELIGLTTKQLAVLRGWTDRPWRN